MSRRVPFRLAMSTAFVLAACIGEPDYEGRLCDFGNLCPAGFVCGEDLRCHKGAPIGEVGDAGLSDTSLADAGLADAAEMIDAGGPSSARCNEPVHYPAQGWEARTFTLSAADELDSCLGVEDLASETIDRNYLSGGPVPGVTDRFGTRYTAHRTFQRGTETFRISYDDGIRIFIGANRIFEDWRRGVVVLDETFLSPYLDGDYDLTIEHFENTGSSRIEVQTTRGCEAIEYPEDGWNVAYYRLTAENTIDRSDCLGVEAIATDVFARDWSYGPVFPSSGLTLADNWAAIGRGRRSLYGLTRFTFDHDDGLRLSISGTVVYDQLGAPANSQTMDVYTTGAHDFEFELHEITGSAHANISWVNECSIPITPDSGSWAARYYSVVYDGSSNPPSWTLDYGDCRYAELIPAAQLDFDWMTGSPPYIENNFGLVELFGAEFWGPRSFAANTHVSLKHDDGLRVFVDGNITYDSWVAPQVITNGGLTISGTHDIYMQYFENLGGAFIHFNY